MREEGREKGDDITSPTQHTPNWPPIKPSHEMITLSVLQLVCAPQVVIDAPEGLHKGNELLRPAIVALVRL